MSGQMRKIKTGSFTEKAAPKKKQSFFKQKMMIRAYACLAIIIALGMVAFMENPLAKKVKSGIVSALTFEIDVDKTLGKLKFVQRNDSQLKDVLTASGDMKFMSPAKDCVAVSGNMDNTKLMLETTKLTDIVCPAGGIIENITDNNHFEVTIDHGNDVKSVLKFTGAMAVLNEGDSLKKGDYIGLVDKGQVVEFKVIKNGKNTNPYDMMQ